MTRTGDPTAIPLECDPTQKRFRGVAFHGDTPFDVPFISEITENLWMGGCEAGLVLPAQIDHVVSLYPWEAYAIQHEIRSMLALRLYDGTDEPDGALLAGLASWVNVCRADGPTLVHCQAGLNRSGLVTGLALVLGGMAPAEAVALLRTKRSPAVLCNPVFERWLLGYGRSRPSPK